MSDEYELVNKAGYQRGKALTGKDNFYISPTWHCICGYVQSKGDDCNHCGGKEK